MGWAVWGSNPVGGKFSALLQTGSGAHPTFCTMGTGSFLGVRWPGHGIDPHPHLVSRLKKQYSYISTPPLAFMTCSRVKFALFITECIISLPVWNISAG